MNIKSIDKAGQARRAAERFVRRNETLEKVRPTLSEDQFIKAKAKTDARNGKDVADHPGIGRFLKAMGFIKTHQAPFTPPTEEIKHISEINMNSSEIKPVSGLMDMKSFFE